MWKVIFILDWILLAYWLLYEWPRCSWAKLVDAVGVTLAIVILFVVLVLATIGAAFVIVLWR
jgi:hypothetical protein